MNNLIKQAIDQLKKHVTMIKIDDPELFRYISGESFLCGLDVQFNLAKQVPVTREELLVKITQNKRIIHIGFADHIPLIEQKIQDRLWLHGLLEENCTECYGVDISEEAVEYVKTQFNYSNVVYADILKEDILRDKEGVYDFILLGEILEHVDNPVEFLKTIREKYDGRVKQMIITVPNVLCRQSINYIKNGVERINTDHRYWFSPYTISKVAHQAGLKTERLAYANLSHSNIISLAIRKLEKIFKIKRRYPESCFSTIIYIASL